MPTVPTVRVTALDLCGDMSLVLFRTVHSFNNKFNLVLATWDREPNSLYSVDYRPIGRSWTKLMVFIWLSSHRKIVDWTVCIHLTIVTSGDRGLKCLYSFDCRHIGRSWSELFVFIWLSSHREIVGCLYSFGYRPISRVSINNNSKVSIQVFCLFLVEGNGILWWGVLEMLLWMWMYAHSDVFLVWNWGICVRLGRVCDLFVRAN